MYDQKTEANEFVGDDRAEAVSKACRFYGIEESELKIVIPESGEIFGSGARTVLVAIPKDAKPITPHSDSGDRGGRGRDSGRGSRGRGGDRDRGDGGGRGGHDRDRNRGQAREVVSAVREKPKGESRGVLEGQVGEVGQFILGIVERMGLGEFRIAESSEGDFTVYELRGEAALALGSGDGRAVDALQLLGNQFAMGLSDDSPRVVVDAEGDAERRTEFLERLARRAAGRASETKRAVALDPMNARDRRILHMTVKEIDAVATMSVGSGRYRQVVVVSEGADEYDDAVASSSASQED